MRCTSCNHEFSGSFGTACPACGVVAQNPFEPQPAQPAQPPPGPTPWTPPGAPTSAEPMETGDGIPWEVEQSAASLFTTLKVILLETEQTFKRAGIVKSIGPAFLYVMLLGTLGGILGQLWQFLLSPDILQNFIPSEYHDAVDGAFGPSIGDFVAVPMGVAFAVFINAGLNHVALMIVGGANKGFEATFRVVAFATGSVALFQIIPGIGHIAQIVWGLIATVIGFRELHQTTTGKAAFGALFPLMLCCLCVGIIAAIGAAAVGASQNF